MFSELFETRHNPIVERCQTDFNTKLRLKYNPYYHVIESCQGVHVKVAGKDMIMMSSNEYLGLSGHAKVKQAAQAAIDQWGTSPCGSRLSNGSRRYHIELEEALAKFLGKEACHIIVAGYLACISSLTALVQRDDILIVDKSIHSALWDGASLTKATLERFSHEDLSSLELLLKNISAEHPKIIVIDGVCSMEGHIAPLPEIIKMTAEHKVFLIVDDAHGLGVLGNQGRGVVDHFKLTSETDLIVGTFSKALASTGGFIAGDRSTIEFLRSNSRQIIFSAALSPASAASALAAIQLIQEEPEHRQRLWENTHYLQRILKDLGLDDWNSRTPVIPIVIGNKEKCFWFWKSLWDQGFFTVMSISPGVPAGKDLIRIAVSAQHTTEQLDRFGDALKIAMKKAGVYSILRPSP